MLQPELERVIFAQHEPVAGSMRTYLPVNNIPPTTLQCNLFPEPYSYVRTTLLVHYALLLYSSVHDYTGQNKTDKK